MIEKNAIIKMPSLTDRQSLFRVITIPVDDAITKCRLSPQDIIFSCGINNLLKTVPTKKKDVVRKKLSYLLNRTEGKKWLVEYSNIKFRQLRTRLPNFTMLDRIAVFDHIINRQHDRSGSFFQLTSYNSTINSIIVTEVPRTNLKHLRKLLRQPLRYIAYENLYAEKRKYKRQQNNKVKQSTTPLSLSFMPLPQPNIFSVAFPLLQ